MPGDDSLFEKALARQLRAPNASNAAQAGGQPSGEEAESAADGAATGVACLDAEMLAAYHERALPEAEMSACKEHMVSCARCQEILAQLEATDEISLVSGNDFTIPADYEQEMLGRSVPRFVPLGARPAVAASESASRLPVASDAGTHDATDIRKTADAVEGKRRGRRVSVWIAPAAAIAAVLLLWTGVHLRTQNKFQKERLETAENHVQAREYDAPAAPAPVDDSKATAPPEAATRKAAKPLLPGSAGGAKNLRASSSPSEDTRPADKKLTHVQPQLAAPRAVGAPALNGRGVYAPEPASPKTTAPAVEVTSDATAPSTAESATAANAPKNEAATKSDFGSATGPAKTSAQNSVPPAPREQSERAGTAAVSAQVAPAWVHHASGMNSMARSVSLDVHLIPAPTGKIVWRVGLAGRIEHSADGGTTWTPQSSGVTTTLLWGAAPSEAVCWIVGREATLLLTNDGGAHWTKLASPIQGDLGGVQAADALHATVWDAANQNRFATTDGGATWVPTKNQQ